MADEKSLVKASLSQILHNPEHLTIYQDRVNIINHLVIVAYLFARYILVHAYEDNKNESDAFNADIFMTDGFFFEVLRSLQTRTHRASKDENTLWNRYIINKYITDFCALYHFQLVMIPGIASNLKAYIARQMLTAYINNAEM